MSSAPGSVLHGSVDPAARSGGVSSGMSRLLWSVPLGWQLSALYTLLLAITLGLVGLLVYTQQEQFLVQDAASRLVQAARAVTLASAVDTSDAGGHGGDHGQGGQGRPPSDEDLARILSAPEVTVAILDGTGKIITTTRGLAGDTAPVVDAPSPAQVSAALASDLPVQWTATRPDGSRRVVVLLRIAGRNLSDIGASTYPAQGGGISQPSASGTQLLLQSAGLAAADAAIKQLGTYLLLGVLGGTIAGLVLGIAFTRLVLRPLDRVADTAEAIADGDLHRRLQLPEGRNEVARLGKTFDHMVGQLVASLEAQRRFVADASHELRTPLTSLKGLAEILMIGAHGNDTRVVEQSASAINSELERLIRLVTDLLTLSRLDSSGGTARRANLPPEQTRIDVCTTIEAATAQMEPLAGRHHVRLTRQCEGPLWVFGDPGQMKQVLLNLLDNALRYTPAGGEVGLRATHQGGKARLEVWDTGSGISARELPHIFERFYRGDASRTRATGNSGLGLSIVRTIIEATGGTIEVNSTPGQGTRFTITLPLASGQAPDREESGGTT
ncbi:MAG: HAMP domain-containing histidine kinase [Chloroflexota bacterium]|nr:HAMP domain-containing histidine kinase [Chloroflexota bacterium]